MTPDPTFVIPTNVEESARQDEVIASAVEELPFHHHQPSDFSTSLEMTPDPTFVIPTNVEESPHQDEAMASAVKELPFHYHQPSDCSIPVEITPNHNFNQFFLVIPSEVEESLSLPPKLFILPRRNNSHPTRKNIL